MSGGGFQKKGAQGGNKVEGVASDTSHMVNYVTHD